MNFKKQVRSWDDWTGDLKGSNGTCIDTSTIGDTGCYQKSRMRKCFSCLAVTMAGRGFGTDLLSSFNVAVKRLIENDVLCVKVNAIDVEVCSCRRVDSDKNESRPEDHVYLAVARHVGPTVGLLQTSNVASDLCRRMTRAHQLIIDKASSLVKLRSARGWRDAYHMA